MMTKVGIALAMIIVCGSAFAADGTKSPTAGQSKKSAPPPTTVFNRKLQSTTIVQGDADLAVVGETFTNIDSPLKFTCPSGGCTVSAEVTAQVGNTNAADNLFAVCGLLDGSYMPPADGCPYNGETLVDGGYSTGTFTFTQSGVHAGSHTLQSQIFIAQGGTLANYTITYRLFTP